MNFNLKKYKNETEYFVKEIFPILKGIQPLFELSEKNNEVCPIFTYKDIEVVCLITKTYQLSLICQKLSISVDISYDISITEAVVVHIKCRVKDCAKR